MTEDAPKFLTLEDVKLLYPDLTDKQAEEELAELRYLMEPI